MYTAEELLEMRKQKRAEQEAGGDEATE
jgi:hypothetical protein